MGKVATSEYFELPNTGAGASALDVSSTSTISSYPGGKLVGTSESSFNTTRPLIISPTEKRKSFYVTQGSISNLPDKCAKHISRSKRSILTTTNSQSKNVE